MGQAATEIPVGAQHQLLDNVVRDEILRQILTGELAPGARLIETTIADSLGVSRGPVRAAIRQLELEGFVVVSPRRGASVATVSITEALECYDVRTALEGLAAGLAAVRRTDDDIAHMRAILIDGQDLMKQRRWDQLSQLNNDFHVALATASGNNELVLLMRQYAKRIAWMFARSAQRRGSQAWQEHTEIVDAIVAGNSSLASTLAQRHIQGSREMFVICTPIAADPILPAAAAPSPGR